MSACRSVVTGMVLAALSMGGCAQRGSITLAPAAAAVGDVQPILVASGRVPLTGQPGYSRDVAPAISFSRVDVSVPPDRAPGTVTFPQGGVPDPRTDFLTVANQPVADGAAFVRAVNAAVAARPVDQRGVFVFVHGFNTNFAEGLYRQAQMSHDFQAPGVSVNYAWPSAGNVRAYATDRESALIARDGLQQVLELLARSNATQIVVAGHSMGAMVVMEGLRQIALSGDTATLARVDSVVLMAPDLDIEVFRRQMQPLLDAPPKVYVITSSRDRALQFSARLRGSAARLGAVTDATTVADLPVTVIDLTQFQAESDSLNHFKAATSPDVIALVTGMDVVGLRRLEGEGPASGPFRDGLSLLQNATSAVLDPVKTR